jgi:hypothetical protein
MRQRAAAPSLADAELGESQGSCPPRRATRDNAGRDRAVDAPGDTAGGAEQGRPVARLGAKGGPLKNEPKLQALASAPICAIRRPPIAALRDGRPNGRYFDLGLDAELCLPWFGALWLGRSPPHMTLPG